MARPLRHPLPPLLLASASPRRHELLARVCPAFTVVPSDAEEIHNEQLTAREVCQANAYRKARVIAQRHPDHLILGADTLVSLGAKLFGKPADSAEACRMLAELQGRTHEVVTGVCLLHLRAHRLQVFAESTWVTFKPLGAPEIRDYVAAVHTLDKAGAYGIQELGGRLVAAIDGSYDNVVGLPTEALRRALERWI